MLFRSSPQTKYRVYPVYPVSPVSPVSYKTFAVDWEDCKDREDRVDQDAAPPFEVQNVPAPPEEPRFSCGRRCKSFTGLRGTDDPPHPYPLPPQGGEGNEVRLDPLEVKNLDLERPHASKDLQQHAHSISARGRTFEDALEPGEGPGFHTNP